MSWFEFLSAIPYILEMEMKLCQKFTKSKEKKIL